MTAFEMARLARATPAAPTRVGPRTYDREQILDAIRQWSTEYGSPPTWLDWEPAAARRRGQPHRAAIFELGSWPSTAMVCRQFTTLGSAIQAAGLAARPAPRTKPNLVDGEGVLQAIREWTRCHGDPPAQTDLDPYRARRTGQAWRAERYRSGDWPSLATVRHHHGTLSEAIAAAGLEPRPLSETVVNRAQRRRRNRLALVDHLARTGRENGPAEIARGVRSVAAARRGRDADALETALLALAGAALGWADRVSRAGSAALREAPRAGAQPAPTSGVVEDTGVRPGRHVHER